MSIQFFKNGILCFFLLYFNSVLCDEFSISSSKIILDHSKPEASTSCFGDTTIIVFFLSAKNNPVEEIVCSWNDTVTFLVNDVSNMFP